MPDPDGTLWEAALSGSLIQGVAPKGTAQCESFVGTLAVQVQGVNLPDGTKLTVNYGGDKPGAGVDVGTLTLANQGGQLLPVFLSSIPGAGECSVDANLAVTSSPDDVLTAGPWSKSSRVGCCFIANLLGTGLDAGAQGRAACDGDFRTLAVRVSDAAQPDGTVLTVSFDGNDVETITLAQGHGQGSCQIPAGPCSSASIVQVRRPGGTVVVSQQPWVAA